MISILSHFSQGKLIEQDEHHSTYQLNRSKGNGTVTIYPIFSGVEVVLLDLHAPRYLPVIHGDQNILEINYCLSGRAECKMKDGCLQYLGEGDFFLNTLRNHSASMELPLGYYRGIVIMIDIDEWNMKSFEVLFNTSIDIKAFANRFFAADECFLIPTREETSHFFAGMCAILPKVRGEYFKLKVFELILYLEHFDSSSEKQTRSYTRQQVDIVKQIEKRMARELSHRFTIEELAREYGISVTALKTHFKGVYGQSISIYMKEYRIRKATALLRETDKSVADIALSVGYESQSKFGAAFKNAMKLTPLEYRKKIEV